MKSKNLLFAFLVIVFFNAEAQWKQTCGPFSADVSALATSSTKVFAGTFNNGYFLSPDNGLDWESIDIGLTGSTAIYSIDAFGANVYVGTDHGGIRHSVDSGLTFTGSNAGLPNIFDATITSMTHTASGKILAGVIEDNFFTGEGVYISTDNGISWNPSNTGLTDWRVTSFASIGSIIFAGTYGSGVFISFDEGGSWQATTLTSGNIRALAASGSIIAAGDYGGGVHVSVNSGSSWSSANTGLTNDSIESLAISGTDLLAGSVNGLFLSSDTGAHWTPINPNSGLIISDIGSLTVKGGNIFAGTTAGVFVSSDASISWTGSGVPSSWIRSLTLTGGKIFAGTEYDYGTPRGGLFVSTNNGNSWSRFTDIPPSSTIYGTGTLGSYIFAGAYDIGNGGGGVFVSGNNGISWTQSNSGIPDGNHSLVTALSVINSNVFIGSYGGLFVSADSGASWSAVNCPLPASYTITAFAQNGNNVYAGTGYGVLKSADYGATWFYVDTLTLINSSFASSFTFVGNKIFAGTYSGVYISSDSGTTWIPSTTGLPPNERIASITTDGQNIFASSGFSEGVFISSDTGATWSSINTGLSDFVLQSQILLAVSGSDLIAGTWGGGVWRRPLSDFNFPTGVSSPINNDNSHFSIYPNPFTNSLSVKGTSKNGNVILYDESGKKVLQEKTSEGETFINTEKAAKGFYLLKIEGEKEKKSFKVLKK